MQKSKIQNCLHVFFNIFCLTRSMHMGIRNRLAKLFFVIQLHNKIIKYKIKNVKKYITMSFSFQYNKQQTKTYF